MTQPRAVIDVVVAKPCRISLLEQIGLFVGAFGDAETGHGAGPVARCRQDPRPQRPAPRPSCASRKCVSGLAGSTFRPLAGASSRRIRVWSAGAMVDIVEAEPALDAEPLFVRRAVRPSTYLTLSVLDLQDIWQPTPQYGQTLSTSRSKSRCPRSGVDPARCGHQRPGRAGLHAFAAGHAGAVAHRVVIVENDLRIGPRPAMPITSLTCTSRQARTQRLHWIQASRLTRIATMAVIEQRHRSVPCGSGCRDARSSAMSQKCEIDHAPSCARLIGQQHSITILRAVWRGAEAV